MNPFAVVAAAAALGYLAAWLRRRVPAAAAAATPTPPPARPDATGERTPLPAYAKGPLQTECDPAAKPGTKAMMLYVLRLYGGRSGGIARPCAKGGRSEHKEGRAWDWFPASKADGDALVRDLLATDEFGRPHALARQLGVRYMIWFRRIWTAGRAEQDGSGPDSGWRPYTRTGSATIEHRDHIHVTQSKAAAARADLTDRI